MFADGSHVCLGVFPDGGPTSIIGSNLLQDNYVIFNGSRVLSTAANCTAFAAAAAGVSQCALRTDRPAWVAAAASIVALVLLVLAGVGFVRCRGRFQPLHSSAAARGYQQTPLSESGPTAEMRELPSGMEQQQEEQT